MGMNKGTNYGSTLKPITVVFLDFYSAYYEAFTTNKQLSVEKPVYSVMMHKVTHRGDKEYAFKINTATLVRTYSHVFTFIYQLWTGFWWCHIIPYDIEGGCNFVFWVVFVMNTKQEKELPNNSKKERCLRRFMDVVKEERESMCVTAVEQRTGPRWRQMMRCGRCCHHVCRISPRVCSYILHRPSSNLSNIHALAPCWFTLMARVHHVWQLPTLNHLFIAGQ